MNILRILIALFIYLLFVLIIYLYKPSAMFDENGNIKGVGFSDNNESILSLYIVSPILCMVFYIIIFSINI